MGDLSGHVDARREGTRHGEAAERHEHEAREHDAEAVEARQLAAQRALRYMVEIG